MENFEERLAGLLEAANKAVATANDVMEPLVEAEHLRKRVRLVRSFRKAPDQRSAYGFVDKETGDVLKAASWAVPAKHARANIQDADYGASACGMYAIKSLR